MPRIADARLILESRSWSIRGLIRYCLVFFISESVEPGYRDDSRNLERSGIRILLSIKRILLTATAYALRSEIYFKCYPRVTQALHLQRNKLHRFVYTVNREIDKW